MNVESLRSQRILACLGDESRFRVMLELIRGDRCVTDLAERIGLSQSCTTRHLQTLEREGLVSSARSGKRVFFSVSSEPRVAALLAWALPSDLADALSLPTYGGGHTAGSESAEPLPGRNRSKATVNERLVSAETRNRPTPAAAPKLEDESERESASSSPPARDSSDLEDFLL